MSFMEREVFKGSGFECETECGETFWVPDDAGVTVEEGNPFNLEIVSARRVRGWFGRWSAPGYLDCTEWQFSTSKRGLINELQRVCW